MKNLFMVFLAVSIIYTLCLCGCGNGSSNPGEETGVSAATVDAAKETNAKDTEGESTAAANSALRDMISQKVENYGYSGVVYAVQNGKPVCSGGDVNSVYRIASVSKQFTAAAILTLYDEGKLDINSTLDVYFPSYAHGTEVTLIQLLHMRSGIPDYVNIGQDGRITANTSDTLTMESALLNSAGKNRGEILRWILAQDLDFTPDSRYYYCNSNYFLLAEIITRVSGMDYESFIQQRFLTPLKMNSTGFSDTWDNRVEIVDADPFAVWLDCRGICYGCGDMVSNAVDLCKWANEFIDNKILSDNVISLMTEPVEMYGCGLVIDDNSGFVYHEGDLPPYRSALCVSRDGGLILVLLDCQQGTQLSALRAEICAEFEV